MIRILWNYCDNWCLTPLSTITHFVLFSFVLCRENRTPRKSTTGIYLSEAAGSNWQILNEWNIYLRQFKSLFQKYMQPWYFNISRPLFYKAYGDATFNNISVILWRSVLLVEEIRIPRENHRRVASHWQT
jgi:hypothetical protein